MRPRFALRLVVVVLALCGAHRLAQAAEPARLQWVRLEGAESCIDSAALEQRVRQRLGTDPFDPRATRTIEGVVRRADATWRAQIAVRAYSGDADAPLRELESNANDCESLSNAVVLAIALAVDPNAAFSAASRPAPTPPRERIVARQQTAAPAQEDTLAGHAELAIAAQAGLLPRMSLGVGLTATAVLSRRFELAFRARAFPAVNVSGDPAYAMGLAVAAAQICARLAQPVVVELQACGGPSLGLLHATVLVGDRAQPGERAWVGVELGLDAGFPMTRSLALLIGARAVAPLTRYRFIVEGNARELFRQPVLAGVAHAGLQLRFGQP